MLKKRESQVQVMLCDTIVALCRNKLPWKCQLSVEGLIGVTLDNEEIFLVNLREHITKPANTEVESSKGTTNFGFLLGENNERLDLNNHGGLSDGSFSSDTEYGQKNIKRKRKRKRSRDKISKISVLDKDISNRTCDNEIAHSPEQRPLDFSKEFNDTDIPCELLDNDDHSNTQYVKEEMDSDICSMLIKTEPVDESDDAESLWQGKHVKSNPVKRDSIFATASCKTKSVFDCDFQSDPSSQFVTTEDPFSHQLSANIMADFTNGKVRVSSQSCASMSFK